VGPNTNRPKTGLRLKRARGGRKRKDDRGRSGFGRLLTYRVERLRGGYRERGRRTYLKGDAQKKGGRILLS